MELMEELSRYRKRHIEAFDRLCLAISDSSIPTCDLKPFLDEMDDLEVTIRYVLKELQAGQSSND